MRLANQSEHCTLTFDGGVRLAPGETIEGDTCAAVVSGSAGVSSMFGCGVLVPDDEAQALADRTFGAIVDGMRLPPSEPEAAPVTPLEETDAWAEALAKVEAEAAVKAEAKVRAELAAKAEAEAKAKAEAEAKAAAKAEAEAKKAAAKAEADAAKAAAKAAQ
jgi:hypothetical protein